MKISIKTNQSASNQRKMRAQSLAANLVELGFNAEYGESFFSEGKADEIHLDIESDKASPNQISQTLPLDAPDLLLEQIFKILPLNFDDLPLLIEGESKIVRLWTDKLVVTRFKPTVYSFTANRYGEVPGTEIVRLKFTAALFRRMRSAKFDGNMVTPQSAFVAEIENERDGLLLIEKRVESCNIETRIKRYHIGSPVHRYLFTEKYSTVQNNSPLVRWSRFENPVVCFDWRHPLVDESGKRLADEPVSDDYAAVWMYNVPYAKELARQTFLWMEKMFEAANLRLIDMCIFIDRAGEMIYGEISPDCMRVRLNLNDPAIAASADKDLWREGKEPETLLLRYEELYNRLFENK